MHKYRNAILAAGGKIPAGRGLAHLPPAHIAGVGGYLISPCFSGNTCFWMPKYTWQDFLKYNKKLKITNIYTVPSILLRIAKDPAVTDHFKTLTNASGGAAPLDGNLQKAAAKKVGTSDTMIGQVYGLSETTGAATAFGIGEQDATGSIGNVIPNTELRIVDDNFNVRAVLRRSQRIL
jgi:4-coumarate--CoA ligase